MSLEEQTLKSKEAGLFVCTLAPGLRVLDTFVQEKVRHSCISRHSPVKINNEAETEFSLISLTSGCGRAKPTTSFMWYSSRILLEPSIGDVLLYAIAVYFTDPSWPLKGLKEACLYKHVGPIPTADSHAGQGREKWLPLGKVSFSILCICNSANNKITKHPYSSHEETKHLYFLSDLFLKDISCWL